ncbi:MAG: hypothetical protein RIS47_524 [Bacteroidota bacterium]
MKNLCYLSLFVFALAACDIQTEKKSVFVENWKQRAIHHVLSDSLRSGATYLSVYSQIYSRTEHSTHNLTSTVSLRNINTADTIYIDRAEYYNTHGQVIRNYFNTTIFIAPLETVEIVIDESDTTGGSGANFLIHWRIPPHGHTPLVEGIMISTSGQKGLSFTTQGVQVE